LDLLVSFGGVWPFDHYHHHLLEDELELMSKCSMMSCSILMMSIDEHRCLEMMIKKPGQQEKIEAHQEEPSRW